MTILSSHLPSRSCSLASRRLPDAVPSSLRRLCFGSRISNSTSYRGQPSVRARILDCDRENSKSCRTWFATKAKWYPGRCYCSTCGICISTLPRASSMSTLGAYAARSTLSIPIHSSTPCVALDSVSVLLAETLRSSTLKLALLAIGLFGTVMFALIGYLYWSTASYVGSRSDRAIAAEQIVLKEAYERAGRDGLTATISQRIADRRLENGVYLLVDASLVPLGGNLTAWPPGLEGAQGWHARLFTWFHA